MLPTLKSAILLSSITSATILPRLRSSSEEDEQTIKELFVKYMSPMTPEDWAYYMGGVTIGSIVELSSNIDHDSKCFA